MKIATIVGARPQFIKAAVVSRELRKYHTEILIHTGQHYDHNMSDIFFEELDIPRPDYNLGISGGTHGKMTGQMLIKIEKCLLVEKPDMVMVYGDTNSTLAGSLAAVKLHIPVCHVEAGGRLGTLNNPEEVNRITTDHISQYLMCCTKSAVDFLQNEGLTERVYLVGDPMYDAFLYYGKKVKDYSPEHLLDFDNNVQALPQNFFYMTCHREENAGSDDTLIEILNAMNQQKYPCVYPVHPRNQDRIRRLSQEYDFFNIIFCKPVGYLMSVFLTTHARKIVTDSGGLQREAFFAGKQCVTIFDWVVWPETMIGNWNQLARADEEDILEKLNVPVTPYDIAGGGRGQLFGNGKAAERIVRIIDSISKGD